MAKTKISEFSSTPANNTDIDSINIAEGCAPSNINDAIRELMAQLKDFQIGAVGDSFNGPIGSSTASTGAFTNITASGTLGVTGVATLGAGAILNTPASVTLTNATGLPISTGVSGLGTGVATALAVNVGSAGAPVVNGGALGTPSSGTVTNLTGTASININGTVGATTPTTGAFTTLSASSSVTLSGGTANGVTYLNGSKVLTSGSALTFDGTNLTAVGSLVAQRTGGVSQYARISNTGGTATFISDNQASSAYTGFVFQGLSTASGTPVDYLNLTSTSLYTASGINVGIGTSSPAYKLEVVAPAGDNIISTFRSGDATAANNAGGGFRSISSATATSRIAQMWLDADGANLSGGDYFYIQKNGNSGNVDLVQYSNAAMTFTTNAIERMRLDSAGNLGLGVTPSAWGGSLKALQIGYVYGGALSSNPAGNTTTHLTHNAWFDGTNWKYGGSSIGATRYTMEGASAGSTHAWYVSAGGTAGDAISFTQAMSLTAAGDLLVGATSTTPANVNGTIAFGGADAGIIYLERQTGTDQLRFYVGGNRLGYLNTASSAVTLGTANYPLVFATNDTERARITSGGYFKASNTGEYQNSTGTYHELRNNANANTVRISNNIASGYTDAVAQVSFTGYTPNDGTAVFLWCNDTTAVRTKILSNGGLANYSANNVNLSDRREKTNFSPATSYLDKICAIPVQTFNYIDQNFEEDDGLTLGVVAQDVQAVAPELVTESNWGTKEEPKMRLSIYQTDLQYALMKALQELKAEFDSYKASHP